MGRVKGATTSRWARALLPRWPLPPPGQRPTPLVLMAMALAVTLPGTLPGTAGAQEAEVVAPDRQGDFARLEWQGPRGLIRQRHWLVVDPDSAGLTCRDGAGRPTIALRPGAIVATDPAPPTPLRLVQGRPWLRVTAPALAIQRDSRSQERGQPVRCWVRANRLYLAPILPEFLPTPDRKTP